MMRPARPIPVTLRCRGTRVDRPALRELITRILEAEQVAPLHGVSLTLAGERLLRRLNRVWRGLDRTTDVLAFPLDGGPPLPPGEGDPEARLVGEVVVNLVRCREQAKEAGCRPGVELIRLVIHGTLHLLGYDHEDPADRRRMTARERRYRAWASRAGIGSACLRQRAG